MIRDESKNVSGFSINIEANRELAGGKINDKVRVSIRWEDTERKQMWDIHKTPESKTLTIFFFQSVFPPPPFFFLLCFPKASWFIVYKQSDGICQETPSFALFFTKTVLFCFGFLTEDNGLLMKIEAQSSLGESEGIFFLKYHFIWELSCKLYSHFPYFICRQHPPAYVNISSNQKLLHGHTSHWTFLDLNIRLEQSMTDFKQSHDLNFSTVLEKTSSTR